SNGNLSHFKLLIRGLHLIGLIEYCLVRFWHSQSLFLKWNPNTPFLYHPDLQQMPLHWHNALSLLFHKVADPFHSPYNLLMTHANIIMYGLCHSPAYIFVFFFFARCSSCDLGRCSA